MNRGSKPCSIGSAWTCNCRTICLPAEFEAIKAREKTYAQELQRSGEWQHLWRVAGEYANYSVFDVESNEALHELLSKLPLFPYLKIGVTPLARHPSAI